MAAWKDVEQAEPEFAAGRAVLAPVTRLNPEATLLVIESWTPQRGLGVVERQ